MSLRRSFSAGGITGAVAQGTGGLIHGAGVRDYERFDVRGADIDEHYPFPGLRSAHFKVLEVLGFFFGVDKRAAAISHAYLEGRVDPDKFFSEGLEEKAFQGFRHALSLGVYKAFFEKASRDPASILVTARKLASGDDKLLRTRLNREAVLTIAGIEGAVSDEAYAKAYQEAKELIVREVKESLISELEAFVERKVLDEQIASFGAKLVYPQGSQVALQWERANLSLDAPPKAVLLGIGATAVRVYSAFRLLTLAGDKQDHNPLAAVRHAVYESTTHGKPAAMRTPEWEDSTGYDIVWALVFASRWAMHGFPVVQPTHMLAASNMVATIPRELVPEISVPWDTFLVEMPDGLLDQDVRFVGLCHVDQLDAIEQDLNLPTDPTIAAAVNGSWVLLVFNSLNTRAERYVFKDLSDLAALDYGKNVAAVSKNAAEPSAEKKRLLELLGSLVLMSLIEMDSEECKAKVQTKPADPVLQDERVKRGQKLPSTWTFVQRRPVTVDARPAVKNYIQRGAFTNGYSPLTVQTLVRGHKKRQPYGPKASLRRWQHVEPYWRGPDGAPIVVRTHRVGPKEEKTAP